MNILTRNDYAEGTAAKHFFFSAIVMLNIGVFLALGTSMRLAWPDVFPNDIPWLHFGRIRPVHVHFVIFGWISMAFAGAMCYMTPALCKTKLWSEKLGVWNCWAWNLGMVAVFFTLINGLTTGREYQDLIWPLDIYMLLLVFAPLALNIWMTMLKRQTQGLYVTLWFFGAALLFIILSYFIGAVPDFFPVTGLSEAYMTWWHAHNILGLWITPVSAAIAYYIIPKVSGNTLYSHKIGHLHFWSIVAFYSTPGAHHLMGAPIPEWLKSFASVSGVLIMIPALAFVVNMLMTMKDKWWMFTKSIPLQWALTGVLFAIPLNIQGAFQQTRALNWYIHGTHWIVAHAHLALLGDDSGAGRDATGLVAAARRKPHPGAPSGDEGPTTVPPQQLRPAGGPIVMEAAKWTPLHSPRGKCNDPPAFCRFRGARGRLARDDEASAAAKQNPKNNAPTGEPWVTLKSSIATSCFRWGWSGSASLR